MKRPERSEWALAQLRRSQVRITPVREKVLAFLARQAVPATLNEISGSEELARQFDDATVYRTLVLFLELEIARQVQFQGRQAHFLLNAPGECFSFLLCRCCGAITPLAHGEEMHSLERQMSELHGYTDLTHELELYGTCPNCQEHTQTCCKPTKLLSGVRLRGRFGN
jgi:Fur family transcriptional regulator, peroxide stress response regulator